MKFLAMVFLFSVAVDAVHINREKEGPRNGVQPSDTQMQKPVSSSLMQRVSRDINTLAVLSIASSVDNWAVAMAVGISGTKLSFPDCFIIAAVGGLASGLADFASALAGQWLKAASSLLCGAFFIGLALNEFWNYFRGADDQETKKGFTALGKQQIGAFSLAVPLSLNNLAGGVAGGLAGDAFWLLGGCSALASLLFMVLGNYAGRKLGMKLPFSTEIMAGVAFFAIGLIQAGLIPTPGGGQHIIHALGLRDVPAMPS